MTLSGAQSHVELYRAGGNVTPKLIKEITVTMRNSYQTL